MVTASKIRRPGIGIDIAFDLRGSGEPVVQLHGLTSSRRRDEILGLNLTEGVRGCQVLRYDACGHGQSTGTPNPLDYTWPHLADDLLALLDEVFPGRAVHGVGQSMGTATLLHAALREPERFTSLCLGIPPTAWKSRVAQAARYEASAELIAAQGGVAFAESTRYVRLPPAVDPARPFTVPDVPDALLPDVFRGAGMSDLPPLAAISDLAIPTLILAWTRDPSHPQSVAHTLAEAIPGARVEIATHPTEVARWPRTIENFVLDTAKALRR